MKKYRTFLKYTIFYIIFMLFSFSGLFFLIKNNLSESVEDSLNKQMDSNMTALCDSLSNDFIKLSETASQIRTDLSKNLIEYKSNYINKVMYDSLSRYVVNNSLLTDIVCCHPETESVFSRSFWVVYKDKTFIVHNYFNDLITVPSSMIYQNSNRLWNAKSEEGKHYLFYFPEHSKRRDITFYILDNKELKSRLEGVFLPNTVKIQIADHHGIIYEQSHGGAESKDCSQYEFNLSYPQIKLVVFINSEITKEMVQKSLRIPYLVLILISSIGIFCFFFFIRNTYIPLKNFAESVYRGSLEQRKSTDIMNLGDIYRRFSYIQDENKSLLLKVHNYRIEIQKSILGTITQNQKELFSDSDIDMLFSEEHHVYFIVYFIFSNSIAFDTIIDTVKIELDKIKGRAFLLEKEEETGTLLISGDSSILRDKSSLICIIACAQVKVQFEFYCSNASNTIMNFPRLYEEAMQESLQPIIQEKLKKPLYSEVTQYPYQLIDEIQNDLMHDRYDDGVAHLKEIFNQLEERKFPDFFIRSIYLDIITLIFDQLCIHDIVFAKYSNSYYNALYLCRSKDYAQKDKINASVMDLLCLYIKLLGAPELTITHIEEFINEHYLEDDFSISKVSETFQISIPYFSSWFSKETNQKFVDYVWSLRFQRTLNLMKDLTIPMKDIALQVGYQNYSSFSRKFKEHTGKSPNEFREQYINEQEKKP